MRAKTALLLGPSWASPLPGPTLRVVQNRSRRFCARGALTSTDRAHAKWKQVLAEFIAPPAAAACAEALDELIARRTAEGGAPPLA